MGAPVRNLLEVAVWTVLTWLAASWAWTGGWYGYGAEFVAILLALRLSAVLRRSA